MGLGYSIQSSLVKQKHFDSRFLNFFVDFHNETTLKPEMQEGTTHTEAMRNSVEMKKKLKYMSI